MPEFGASGTSGWYEQTCTFVGEPDVASFHVYAGRSENTTTPARYWIDDVMLIGLDHALSNVIQTTVTDFVVVYGTFRLNFHRFDRFELDLRGHTQP